MTPAERDTKALLDASMNPAFSDRVDEEVVKTQLARRLWAMSQPLPRKAPLWFSVPAALVLLPVVALRTVSRVLLAQPRQALAWSERLWLRAHRPERESTP